MTDIWQNLGYGLTVVAAPANLLAAFAGALVGTLIGVLPGIGPLATVALLLPLTFALDPVTALVMLAGIYYGAQYGGSTTAILVNIPGESSSVVTCLDGHAMARQGRAGSALAVAALGSFFAGCVATVAIAVFGPTLTSVALSFRPADYCSLMVFALVAAVTLARGSPLKAFGMVFVGLLLGTVGTDLTSGTARLTLGLPELAEGLGFVPVAMGIFGITEIVANLERRERRIDTARIGRLLPSASEFRASIAPVFRGTGIGILLGILPGGGAAMSSYASYMVEKRLAREPGRFGHGAIEGVAGPEAANNAGAQASFIPLLSLGVPGNALMALLIGAMMIHGIVPGPQIMTTRPDLYWGLIASMWVGNLMLVIINLPLIGLWVALLRVPYRLLYLVILVFCAIGAYAVNNSSLDLIIVIVFSIFGYLCLKFECETPPMILGLVLGPLFEEYLRRALIFSKGDWSTFVTHPISLGFLLAASALLALIIFPAMRSKRHEVFQDG